MEIPQEGVLDAEGGQWLGSAIRRESLINTRVHGSAWEREGFERLVRGDFDIDPDGNESQGELRLNLQLVGASRITTLGVSQVQRLKDKTEASVFCGPMSLANEELTLVAAFS
jgi:hypothetical protein